MHSVRLYILVTLCYDSLMILNRSRKRANHSRERIVRRNRKWKELTCFDHQKFVIDGFLLSINSHELRTLIFKEECLYLVYMSPQSMKGVYISI